MRVLSFLAFILLAFAAADPSILWPPNGVHYYSTDNVTVVIGLGQGDYIVSIDVEGTSSISEEFNSINFYDPTYGGSVTISFEPVLGPNSITIDVSYVPNADQYTFYQGPPGTNDFQVSLSFDYSDASASPLTWVSPPNHGSINAAGSTVFEVSCTSGDITAVTFTQNAHLPLPLPITVLSFSAHVFLTGNNFVYEQGNSGSAYSSGNTLWVTGTDSNGVQHTSAIDVFTNGCGDGSCNNGETCSTCGLDCCPTLTHIDYTLSSYPSQGETLLFVNGATWCGPYGLVVPYANPSFNSLIQFDVFDNTTGSMEVVDYDDISNEYWNIGYLTLNFPAPNLTGLYEYVIFLTHDDFDNTRTKHIIEFYYDTESCPLEITAPTASIPQQGTFQATVTRAPGSGIKDNIAFYGYFKPYGAYLGGFNVLEVSDPVPAQGDTFTHDYFITCQADFTAWVMGVDASGKVYFTRKDFSTDACGDGVCGGGETSANCPFDCVPPPPTAPPATISPTLAPTPVPPTSSPTISPSSSPSMSPTIIPSQVPTNSPSSTPAPSSSPTSVPTVAATSIPSKSPSKAPSKAPTTAATQSPSKAPTHTPTVIPSRAPTFAPNAPLLIVNRNSGMVVTASSLNPSATINLTKYDSVAGPTAYQVWNFNNKTGYVTLQSHPDLMIGGGTKLQALSQNTHTINYSFKLALISKATYTSWVNKWSYVPVPGTSYYGIQNVQLNGGGGSWWNAPYPNTPANEPQSQVWSSPRNAGAYVQEFQLVPVQ